MVREWNGNGTGMEREWSGTELNGKMEQNGTKRNGTEGNEKGREGEGREKKGYV